MIIMKGANLIINLPNPLLADIVSILPDTEGVRTSVLSHRWKTVWKHSSHLNFDQKQMLKPLIELYLRATNPNKRLSSALRLKVASGGEESNDAIAEAAMLINSVIDTHFGPLKSCRIRHLAESCASGEVVGWMRKLLGKRVREISMEREILDYLNPYYAHVKRYFKNRLWTLDLPFEVFSGFEVLELKDYYLKIVPSSDTPQILKSLTFNSVGISPNNLQGILSHCLTLENLTLEECNLTREVKINSPSLKFFKIFKMFVTEIVVSATNIEVIEIDTITCSLENLVFKNPKLQVLRYYHGLKNEGQYFGLYGDKFLTTSKIIETCSGIMSPQGSYNANIFENLVTLCIDLDPRNVRNAIALSFALKSCHHLKNLEINQVIDDLTYQIVNVYDKREDDILPIPKFLSWKKRELCECINNQLKTLCMREFTGKEFEVEFVKYIITNAQTMKRITIWCADDCLWVEAIQTLCLLSLPKASANLSIILKPGMKYMESVNGSFEKWLSTLRI